MPVLFLVLKLGVTVKNVTLYHHHLQYTMHTLFNWQNVIVIISLIHTIASHHTPTSPPAAILPSPTNETKDSNDYQVLWTAPPVGSGCVHFRATVVEDESVWSSPYTLFILLIFPDSYPCPALLPCSSSTPSSLLSLDSTQSSGKDGPWMTAG